MRFIRGCKLSVLHDYSCMAHGVFESMTGKCPHGCSQSFVNKIFLQAPGLKSARTKNIDKTFQNLANDFKLTDMNNQNGTSAVVRPDPMAAHRREQLENQLMGKLGDTSQAWKMMPEGKNSVGQALQQNKAVGDNSLAPLQPILRAPQPLVVAKHDAKIEV